MTKKDALELLEVNLNYSQDELKAAFAEKAKMFHPEEHEKEYTQILQAYQLLKKGNNRLEQQNVFAFDTISSGAEQDFVEDEWSDLFDNADQEAQREAELDAYRKKVEEWKLSKKNVEEQKAAAELRKQFFRDDSLPSPAHREKPLVKRAADHKYFFTTSIVLLLCGFVLLIVAMAVDSPMQSALVPIMLVAFVVGGFLFYYTESNYKGLSESVKRLEEIGKMQVLEHLDKYGTLIGTVDHQYHMILVSEQGIYIFKKDDRRFVIAWSDLHYVVLHLPRVKRHRGTQTCYLQLLRVDGESCLCNMIRLEDGKTFLKLCKVMKVGCEIASNEANK